jgi:hypothetical protein
MPSFSSIERMSIESTLTPRAVMCKSTPSLSQTPTRTPYLRQAQEQIQTIQLSSVTLTLQHAVQASALAPFPRHADRARRSNPGAHVLLPRCFLAWSTAVECARSNRIHSHQRLSWSKKSMETKDAFVSGERVVWHPSNLLQGRSPKRKYYIAAEVVQVGPLRARIRIEFTKGGTALRWVKPTNLLPATPERCGEPYPD